ncbi:hypothetical protein FPOAC2_14139 [Fusarium poae]
MANMAAWEVEEEMLRLDGQAAPSARRYIVNRLVALADKFHLRQAMQAAKTLARRDQEQICANEMYILHLS